VRRDRVRTTAAYEEDMTGTGKTAGADQERLAYNLLKRVSKALPHYSMIEDGDRIVVAVSGGKDSLTLLRLLRLGRESGAAKYDLVAVHVESDFRCSGCAHRETLERVFEDEGVEFGFEHITVTVGADGKQRAPTCFWCSWNRRKALFLAAERHGCNKVAFGHHADDVAETALLNLFYHGRLETMEPKVVFFDGKITVIRPLVYVPEREISRFAKAGGFPSQLCRCPNSLTSERARMKEILKTVEEECPRVKINLYKAIENRMGSTRNGETKHSTGSLRQGDPSTA